MEKKIRNYIREKGLLDLMDVVINPPFTKEIMIYSNSEKLKPPSIDPYNGTKDPINYIHTFQSHMHYVVDQDAIMCHTFLTIFCLAT